MAELKAVFVYVNSELLRNAWLDAREKRSYIEIAKMVKCSDKWVKNLFNNKAPASRTFDRRNVEAICHVLGIDPHTVILKDPHSAPHVNTSSPQNTGSSQDGVGRVTSNVAPEGDRGAEILKRRVYCNHSIWEIGAHRGDSKLELILEVGQEIVFDSITKWENWCHDPLQQIRTALKYHGVTFPWGHRRFQLKESEAHEAVKELESALLWACRHIVDSFGMPELAAASKEENAESVFAVAAPLLARRGRKLSEHQLNMIPYGREMIAKMQSSLELDRRPLRIELNNDDPRNSSALAFWARARAKWILSQPPDDEQYSYFGPYYSPSDGNQRRSAKDKRHDIYVTSSKEYPRPSSPAGLLLAVVGIFKKDEEWSGLDVLPFASKNCVVRNVWDRKVSTFFRINDERPGDNGDGYCDVTFTRRRAKTDISLTGR